MFLPKYCGGIPEKLVLVRVRQCAKFVLVDRMTTSSDPIVLVNHDALYRHSETFEFSAFTNEEVWQSVRCIKSNTIGHNNISIWFLK